LSVRSLVTIVRERLGARRRGGLARRRQFGCGLRAPAPGASLPAVKRAGVGSAGLALTVAATLLVPASASAAVTIGSDLAPDPTAPVSCGPGDPACTIANTVVQGASTGSPFDGVVVRWRVRSAEANAGGNPARLKIVRPNGAGTFTGLSTSATQVIPDTMGVPTTFTFATQQPIATGDLVALDVNTPHNSFDIRNLTSTDVSWIRWAPPLLDGQTRSPSGAFTGGEHMFNADVEPDCDGDGLGDETQDPDTSSCNPSPPDGAPPDTTLTQVPKNKVKTFSRRADVLFEFVSSEPGSSFQCKLNKSAFEPCDSPHVLKAKARRKKPKRHEFQVRAIDVTGNVDATPATDEFKVKRKRKRK
jgi:hypothetical protein